MSSNDGDDPCRKTYGIMYGMGINHRDDPCGKMYQTMNGIGTYDGEDEREGQHKLVGRTASKVVEHEADHYQGPHVQDEASEHQRHEVGPTFRVISELVRLIH